MLPSFLAIYRNKELNKKVNQAIDLLNHCCLCPRKCGVDRIKDKKGFCITGYQARVFSYTSHFGEEPPVSGCRGSGAIFFSGCNMACVYCQNYQFSQQGIGRELSCEQLAKIMLKLQDLGCHNINLVTPTHVMPQILKALLFAASLGLRIPIVYNTSGYELPEMIKLLEDIVDIFLVDMRYAEAEMSKRYSNASDYPEYNQAVVKQMHKQVGTAKINKQGLIEKGIIIRHLVLPGNISGTEKIMRFIAEQISPQTYVSLMSQYLPCYKANNYPELHRRISEEEYARAKNLMLKFGLSNGWLQEKRGMSHLAGINIKPQ